MTRSERTKEFFKNLDDNTESNINKIKNNRFEIALIIHNMMPIREYTYEDFIRKYNITSLIKIDNK